MDRVSQAACLRIGKRKEKAVDLKKTKNLLKSAVTAIMFATAAIIIPVTSTENVAIIVPWALFLLLCFAIPYFLGSGLVVIRSKAAQTKRDEQIKKQARADLVASLIATAKKYLDHDKFVVSGTASDFENLFAWAAHEQTQRIACEALLEAEKAAHESEVSNLRGRLETAAEYGKEQFDLLVKEAAVARKQREAVQHLLERVCSIMVALLELVPEKVTGEHLRNIRLTLGANMLYAMGCCEIRVQLGGHGAATLKVQGEAATALFRFLQQDLQTGDGMYPARRFRDTPFMDDLARMIAEYETWKLYQAEQAAKKDFAQAT